MKKHIISKTEKKNKWKQLESWSFVSQFPGKKQKNKNKTKCVCVCVCLCLLSATKEKKHTVKLCSDKVTNKNLSSTSVRHNLQIWFGIYKEACLQEYHFSVFNFLLNSIYLLDYKAKTLG